MAIDRRKAKGRKSSDTFAALPHAVMDCQDFRSLSGSALKVLLGLLRQYRGTNNGDLSATFNQAQTWGIGSKDTLSKALRQLEACRLIIRTREGRWLNPGGLCVLYAVTWRKIDDCAGKLDINSTAAPPRSFSLERTKNREQKSYR